MRLYFCKYLSSVSIILILMFFTFSSAGSEELLAQFPQSIPGYVLIDNPSAAIFATKKSDAVEIKSLVNDVSDSYKTMTGDKPEKGIIIVSGKAERHPLLIMTDNMDNIQSEELKALEEMKEQLADWDVSIEDGLRLASMPLPYEALTLLISEGRQKIISNNDTVDVLPDKTGAYVIQKKPWVLCIPTRKSNGDVFKSVFQKTMKAELGWGKYLLLRPFMGKIRRAFVKGLRIQAMVMIYNTWIDRSESMPDDKRKELKDAYESLFDGDEEIRKKE